VVTSFANGQYHSALTAAGVGQPTSGCTDCHVQMLPPNIVMRDAGSGSLELQAMDHSAAFKTQVLLGGVPANKVADADCSVCHRSAAGTRWSDGVFHANIGGAQPTDCVKCHLLQMAKSTSNNVSKLGPGGKYQVLMDHWAPALTFQACDRCHGASLGQYNAPLASAMWGAGTNAGKLHTPLGSTQPTKCIRCHGVNGISEPPANTPTQSSVSYTLALGGTSSNSGQWINHFVPIVQDGGITGQRDCYDCHAADAKATGSAWNVATVFHTPALQGLQTCDGCHGLVNKTPTVTVSAATVNAGVPGTGNNMPFGLTNSTTTTIASATANTGIPAGTFDQINHADYNVKVTKCFSCHTTLGASTVTGIQGKEWAQAKFHAAFAPATPANPLVIGTAGGRCSTCHMNVRPGTAFTAQDHSTFTATSTTDCSSCHTYPGKGGTAAAPNWKTDAVPTNITVGGFLITKPPAANTTTIQGPGPVALLHPTVGTQLCTACHLLASGGKPATGYDHKGVTQVGTCTPCHEAGSNLVGTVWNNTATQGLGAGDTRPYTITALTPSFKNNRTALTVTNAPGSANHFYPADCYACHKIPTGNGTVTTGTAYTTAWKFNHNENIMRTVTTPNLCKVCHGPLPN
jgi:hypothetical protein